MKQKKQKTAPSPPSRKIHVFVLGTILILALSLRLYKIDNPISEWHSWRQADTAAVGRNFVTDFNLLYPKYDDLSNIQSGQYNPEGLRFVEFPAYSATFGLAYRYMPFISLEIWARIVSISFSLALIVVIYYLTLKEEGILAATFSSFTFAVLPFFVFYSRAILPDMTAISLMFISIACLYAYSTSTEKRKVHSSALFLLAVVAAAFSLLIKPTTIFYSITLLYLLIRKHGLKIVTSISSYLFFIGMIAPLALWRLWVARFPVGEPANEWLIYGVNTPQGLQNIFFRPAFFRWIFEERILILILGGYLAAFLVAGILKPAKRSVVLMSIGISSLAFLFTFQGGNVQHDYYQILILPTLAIFVGMGASFFLAKRSVVTLTVLVIPSVVAIYTMSILFSYYKVRDYYDASRDLVSVAKIIQTFTEKDDKIVTDTIGDTTLLYLADRKGYPAVTDDLHVLAASHGMSYFVTFNSEVAEQVSEEFPTVFQSDKVHIFKL